MTFTIIAIISAIVGAISNILAKVLLKDINAKEIITINFFMMGAFLLLLSPLFYKFDATIFGMGLLILISVIDTVANYFYFKTIENTDISIATPILSLAPGFTFLFGWLFIGDVTDFKSIIISVSIIFLIIFFSIPSGKNNIKFSKSVIIPALLSSLLFGCSAIFIKYLLDDLGIMNSPTLYMFRALFIALFTFLWFDFSMKHLNVYKIRMIFFRGLFVILQRVLLYYALFKGNAGVSMTLGNITPIFVFIGSIIFLVEKVTFRKILLVVGILALSLLI